MSHLSDIGFTVKDQPALKELLGRITKVVRQIKTDQGVYLQYEDPSGAELWMFMKDGKIDAIMPYFSGTSSRLIRVIKIEKEKNGMDKGFTGWVVPRDKSEQDYPITFDVPDFYTLPVQQLPKEINVRIAAFADDFRIETMEERIEKAKPGADGKKKGVIAEEAFIPIGQFAAAKDASPSVTASALISGRVLQAEKKTNSFTGEAYLWVYLKTLSAEIDVVCDLKLYSEVPTVGAIVVGTFWLSGKLLP